jgi:hypothetical protein
MGLWPFYVGVFGICPDCGQGLSCITVQYDKIMMLSDDVIAHAPPAMASSSVMSVCAHITSRDGVKKCLEH